MSKSLDQQEECLRRLGVVHDQTLNVGGLAASILGRLVSKGGNHDSDGEVMLIQQGLVRGIFETESGQPQYNLNHI